MSARSGPGSVFAAKSNASEKRPFSQAWRHAVLPRLVRAGRRRVTNRATLLGPSGSHLTSSWVVSWAYCSGIIVMSAP